MTLPYPLEVETGQLKPRPPFARAPFDVDRHLQREIRSAAPDLVIFGARLRPPEPASPREAAEQFRKLLGARFHAWRPNADAATWDLFESQARAEVEHYAQADEGLMRALLLTIDGL